MKAYAYYKTVQSKASRKTLSFIVPELQSVPDLSALRPHSRLKNARDAKGKLMSNVKT